MKALDCTYMCIIIMNANYCSFRFHSFQHGSRNELATSQLLKPSPLTSLPPNPQFMTVNAADPGFAVASLVSCWPVSKF